MLRGLTLLCCCSLLMAADVDREVARVRAGTPAQLMHTDAYLQALRDAYEARSDWSAAERGAWQLHLARAAIFAELADPAARALAEAERIGLPQALQEDALLLRIELWRLRLGDDPETVEPQELAASMKAAGAAPAVLVQAHLAEARRFRMLDDFDRALAACDAALALLAEAPDDVRAAAYHERLQAMEASGMRSVEILRWFSERDDAATRLITDTVGTAALAMIGKSLPGIELQRLGEEGGTWNPAVIEAPTLLYFHAHWAPSCLAIDPLIATVATEYEGLQVVCVSLHLEDQEMQAWNYARVQSLPGLIVSDGKGWQSPLLQALQLEAIPQVVLVGSDGKIFDTNLIVEDAAISARRLRSALDQLLGASSEEEMP